MKRDGIFYRNRSFYISWTDASGQRKRKKTAAKNMEEARGIRSDELRRVEQSRVLGFTVPGKATFDTVADEYLASQRTAVSADGYRRESDVVRMYLKPFFAGALVDVRTARIHKYLASRSAAKAAPATIRKELQILKHLFRFAVQLEYLPTNPAAGISGPKEPAGRVRYLQAPELRGLLNACPEWLRPIAGLAVTTGMRQGEILGLRWMDIDLDNRIVTLARTKNGDSRTVPLNALALLVIQAVRPEFPVSTKPLFDVPKRNRVSVAFARASKGAGIHDFRFHDLRHTFASHQRMSGMDIHTLGTLLGHKNLRMTARYSHLSPAFLAAEVSRLDVPFADILTAPALPENAGK